MYLYRAADFEGNTIDFYLSKSKNYKAAKFEKAYTCLQKAVIV